MKNEKNGARIGFVLSEEKKNELKRIAEEKGLTISSLIKTVVFEYIKNYK